MGKDREYYLKRAGEEQAKSETAVDRGARLAHGKMAKLYTERAGDGSDDAKGKVGATPASGKLFAVRE